MTNYDKEEDEDYNEPITSFNNTQVGECRCRDGFRFDAGECIKCTVPGCRFCDADETVCTECF